MKLKESKFNLLIMILVHNMFDKNKGECVMKMKKDLTSSLVLHLKLKFVVCLH